MQGKLEQHLAAGRLALADYRQQAEQIGQVNFNRVLDAFRSERVSTQHFATTSGYGYNDMGRDKLEDLYARIFGAEAALVRQHIVSGSHAITLALAANLLPGQELLCLGLPYDTMQTVIGFGGQTPGCLKEYGVKCRILDVDFRQPQIEAIVQQLQPETHVVAIQRSRGYSLRPSLSVEIIGQLAQALKSARPDVVVFVDNCYGEFVETQEPTMVGADIMAGSLIKNPGAGLAPAGGYVVGREDLVERTAYRLTIPGAGRELGASLSDPHPFYQGLFLAPQVVTEAVLSAVYLAGVMKSLGFSVSPEPTEKRADIIQTISLDKPERLIAFCQGIQKYSPVDSFAAPEPWPMPGYNNDVIMASGGFVAGSSIELSADAPLRPPYCVFVQGSLSRWHMEYALARTLADMEKAWLL